MRLYHFMTEQFGLEAIRDSRLKIARIDQLNDPFEFLGLSLPGRENRQNREVLGKWKQALSEQSGVICMSRTWRHPLLWSHYAEEHQGLCLGFDCPNKNYFGRMCYVNERPTLRDIERNSLAELDLDDMKMMMYRKFEAWSYEAEYRAFLSLEDRDPVSDLYFLPFSDNMRLAQVIVGARSKVTRDKLKRCLGKRSSAVSSFKARAGFKKFEVVENKRASDWK